MFDSRLSVMSEGALGQQLRTLDEYSWARTLGLWPSWGNSSPGGTTKEPPALN